MSTAPWGRFRLRHPSPAVTDLATRPERTRDAGAQPRGRDGEGDQAGEGGALRPAARLYLAGLVAAALAVVAGLLALAPPDPPDRPALAVVLAGAMVLAGLRPLPFAKGTKLYLDTAVLVAVVLLYEPGVDILIVVCGTALAHVLRREEPRQTLFNTAQAALLVAAASGLLELATWWGGEPDLRQPGWMLLAAAVGVAVCLVNGLVVAAMVALQAGGSLPRVWARLLLGPGGVEWLGHLAQVAVGVAVARLALGHSWAVALLLLPAGAAYQALAHHIRLRRQAEARLVHQAFHDALTGLPNRARFLDRLELALERGKRRGETVALLFVDLDRFKFVNDSLGHGAGDRLLVELGQRLRGCVRPTDTVARLGGDEFTLLLEGLPDGRAAERTASCIAAALDRPFPIDGHETAVTASIGIAAAGPGQTTPTNLLRDADVALYRAKEQGKARWTVFDQAMGAGMRERIALEVQLRRAVARGELRLAFQPLVELATGRIVGVEALVRWQHPLKGLIQPDAFIPLAEETGLILPIGRWVLEEACRQGRAWQERHQGAPIVSVNLSACQFQQPDLVEDVAQALRASGLERGRLKLEITESAMMADPDAAIATLRRLKDLGVRIAIDDFGTGYSSLGRLRRFPVDLLKVDRAFVAGLGHEAEDAAIVRAVVGLARALGLGVVAEGVETGAQLAWLRELGCELGQGFYFGPPVPAEAIAALLEKDAAAVAEPALASDWLSWGRSPVGTTTR